ncbi:hypothetical protein [Paracoccus sulfuroxidans]|uniref:Type III secretion system SsaH family protein n=1 Tax=Paracoccus sulfuroxidans TaxID=384678 RepID=A0A562NTY2_9RHOB|nr:hypothetical protein [Paracoccus sulfuroxidans]TWI35146.1 hypothetical protein IQ24_01655 [Paracoccus sulfuroxidans]
MDQPAATAEQQDDLHLLMAAAILCGQRGVDSDIMPIFDAWASYYPKDALANLGRGLFMVGNGNPEAGMMLIQEAADKSLTRADQAREVLTALQQDLGEMSR